MTDPVTVVTTDVSKFKAFIASIQAFLVAHHISIPVATAVGGFILGKVI